MILCFYAKPGAGKSTLLARCAALNERSKQRYYCRIGRSPLYKLLDRSQNRFVVALKHFLFRKRHYDTVYCTDSTIRYTVPIEYEHLGKWKPSSGSSLFLLEEAGIGLSNRDYKQMSRECKRFAAIHRHLLCDIVLVSQTADVDKCYRQRAQEIYLGRKLLWWTIWRRVLYTVDVSDESKDLVDMYKKNNVIIHFFQCLFSARKKRRKAILPCMKSFIVFRPKWYKYFDSYTDSGTYTMPDVATHLSDDDLVATYKKREKRHRNVKNVIPEKEEPSE